MNESAVDLFLKSCGAQSPLVLECRSHGSDESNPAIREFRQPYLMVGRDPRSDLRLEDSEVSRLHAYFQLVDGRLFCFDLRSRTGLSWSHRKERLDRGWLDPGEVVNIGGFSIRRIVEGPPVGVAVPPEGGAASFPTETTIATSAPEAALELPIKTSEAESLWRIPSTLALIGRVDECQLSLSDESVSRLHASFIRTRSGLWVVDLGSREGVNVAGVRVRWAWLDEGDAVRIGRFTFIVRYPVKPSELSRRDVPISAGAMPLELTHSSPPKSGGRSSGRAGRELARRPLEHSEPLIPASHTQGQNGGTTPGHVVDSMLSWQSPLQGGPAPVTIWQQQMQLMESFHNDMILMVQMFVAMHREHLATVRVELDRVEQLTRELNGLQERLTRTEPTEAGETPSPVPIAPHRDQGSNDGERAENRRAGMGSQPAPPGSSGPKSSPVSKARVDAVAEASEVRRPPPGARGPLLSRDPVETHGLLTERIATLQRERQSYWRRIISQISK